MSDLTGQEIKETYKDLLHMNNGNTGVTSDLSRVFDGEGTGSALHLSDTGASVMGDLGVGTTSPTAKLHVDGDAIIDELWLGGKHSSSATDNTKKWIKCAPFDWSGSTNPDTIAAISMGSDFTSQDDGTIDFYTSQNENVNPTGDSNLELAMRIDSNGRVGIGTTSPFAKLHLQGSEAVASANVEDQLIFHRGFNSGVQDTRFGALSFGTSGNLGNAGRLDFKLSSPYATSGSTPTNLGDVTTVMTLDGGGRVGIGTTSPSAALHVLKDMGSTNVDGNFTLQKTAYTRSSSHPEGSGQFMTHKLHELSYSGDFSTNGNNHLNDTIIGLDVNLDTNAGGQYAALFNGGNVGIGTTSPTVKLDVHGVAYFRTPDGGAFISSWATGQTTQDRQPALILRTNETNNADRVKFNSEGDSWFNGGNVGIGTTSPDAPLHISNDDGINGLIKLESSDIESSIVFEDNGSTGIVNVGCRNDDLKLRSDAGNITFFTHSDSTERMRIDSDGRVGIGTSSPSAKLDVNGTINATTASATVKNFKINHPLPEKSETHDLYHVSIEGPTADLIYRGVAKLENGVAEINIDSASRMTEGTFEALCTNVQCFTTNETSWDLTRGKVTGNILKIECQDPNCTDQISWMVIGERKDKSMLENERTDENGRLIPEWEKPEPEPEPEYEEVEPEEVITEEPVAEETPVSIGASISGESLTEVSDLRAEEL